MIPLTYVNGDKFDLKIKLSLCEILYYSYKICPTSNWPVNISFGKKRKKEMLFGQVDWRTGKADLRAGREKEKEAGSHEQRKYRERNKLGSPQPS